jgi:cytochrome c1
MLNAYPRFRRRCNHSMEKALATSDHGQFTRSDSQDSQKGLQLSRNTCSVCRMYEQLYYFRLQKLVLVVGSKFNG